MFRAPISLVATFLVFGTALSAQISTGLADEAAIRQIVGKYMDARNNHDAEATRNLFTPDADQLVSTGEWRRGIDALIKGAMASSQKETGKSSITLEAIRFLDAALAIGDGPYETRSVGTDSPRRMWTTLIFKRTQAGWRIAAIRNMLPAPNHK